jgi:cyclohexadienyl dehydratase
MRNSTSESAARRWRSALLICALAALALPGAAEQPDHRVLRIGTSGDYAPFSERMADDLTYRGFDISVAKAFARDRGYRIEWVPFVWPELAADMRSDRFDLAMSGITVRTDRSVLGRFSVPVMTSGAVLLYSMDVFAARDAADVASKTGLARFDREGVRIAVNRGGHLERVTRKLFKRASIESIPDNAAVRSALVEARADAIVTDTLEAPGWLRGLDRVGEFGPLTRDRKAYWVAPGRDDLARELDGWLMLREADETLSELRRSAFGNRPQPQTALALSALLAAIDERLSLMPWVAETKRRAGTAVQDAAREDRVLEAGERAVRKAAETAGMQAPKPADVRAFYRVQIEAAKAIQHRTLQGAVARPAEPSDLQLILRPALIRIGDRMAQLIVALHQQPPATDLKSEVALALRRQGLDTDRLAEIRRTIAALAGAVD